MQALTRVQGEKRTTVTEAIQRTSGKEPRLLFDNIGYVIGLYNIEGNKYKSEVKKKGEIKAKEKMQADALAKQKLFINKIENFKNMKEIEPVLLFYGKNRENGIDKVTQELFNEQSKSKIGMAMLLFMFLVAINMSMRKQKYMMPL